MRSAIPSFSFTSTRACYAMDERYWGWGGENVSKDVFRTTDGGFILGIGTGALANTGNIDSFCSFTNKRSIFLKYNEDATAIEWSKCFGNAGDSGFAFLFPEADGSVMIGGGFGSSVAWGVLVTKQDAAGNTLWQHNYSKGKGGMIRGMMATADGGYLILAESHLADTNVAIHYGSWDTYDIWLLKVDGNGNKVWSRVIGGTEYESAAALVPAPGNGFYVVGGTESYDYDCTGNPGESSAYLVRCNDTGGIIWHRCLGGSLSDAATAGCSNGKGGVIMAVNTKSSDGDVHNYHGGGDYWAVEVDSAGEIVWDNCYGSPTYDVPTAICKATDGSVWINGYTNSNNEDGYLVHTDSVGNLIQSALLSSTLPDKGKMLYPLQGGLVLTGGTYYTNDGTFSALHHYGGNDVFLSVYAPWAVGVSNVTSEKEHFSIYPNPVEKLLYIELQAASMIHYITIIDMAGRRVYEGDLRNGVATIDVSGWARGVYYVYAGDGQSREVRVIAVK